MKITLENAICKIHSNDRELIAGLDKLLSYVNQNADYAHAKCLGGISRLNKMVARESDENIVAKHKKMLKKLLFNLEQLEKDRVVRLLDRKTKEFPAGLLPRVLDHLDELGVYWEIDDQRNGNVPSNNLTLVKPLPELRYYQEGAVAAALENERGVLEMATGSGKTVMIATLLSKLKVNALVITPSLDITQGVYETMAHFFGEKQVTILNAKKPKLSKVNVVNIQTLVGMDPKLFENVHCMISDEFHHSGSNSYIDINFTHLRNCYYRYGFTATNFRNAGDDMALEGVLSNRLYHYPASQAIKDGFLVGPEVRWIYNKCKEGKTYQNEYKEWLVQNEDRNLKAAKLAKDHLKDHVIILVQQVAHGKLLQELLPHAELLTGSEDRDERRRMLDNFRSGKLNCLIGTSVLGEGVDLPVADVLILAGGGKSKIQVMQNIGRVMRLFPGKTKATVYDFRDEGSKYLSDHSNQRAAIYAEVYGK